MANKCESLHLTSCLLSVDLWKAAKHQGVEEGVSLGEIFRRAVAEYLRTRKKGPATVR